MQQDAIFSETMAFCCSVRETLILTLLISFYTGGNSSENVTSVLLSDGETLSAQSAKINGDIVTNAYIDASSSVLDESKTSHTEKESRQLTTTSGITENLNQKTSTDTRTNSNHVKLRTIVRDPNITRTTPETGQNTTHPENAASEISSAVELSTEIEDASQLSSTNHTMMSLTTQQHHKMSQNDDTSQATREDKTAEDTRNEETTKRKAYVNSETTETSTSSSTPQPLTVTGNPALEVVVTSPKSGYIQNPGLKVYLKFWTKIDSWVQIAVPKGHYVMLSFPYFGLLNFLMSCSGMTFEIFLGQTLLYDCSGSPPEPALYKNDHGGDLRVHFANPVSRYSYPRDNRGFRLVYSIHDEASLPQKLPGGKWNCSVPYFEVFRQHFPCDLEPQCENGEDEALCTYSSDLCGQGLITIDNRCYLYMIPGGTTTWIEASTLCHTRDAELVSMETPEEWAKVMELVVIRDTMYNTRRRSFSGYIGLQSAASGFPRMYRLEWQWSSGIMAYSRQHWEGDYRPGCVALYGGKQHDPPSAHHTSCGGGHLMVEFMCELNSQPAERDSGGLGPSVALPQVVREIKQTSFIRCPNDHLTHNFLACDVKSACWASGFGDSYTCDAPLTDLPPMFTCTNRLERVPFSMVCDFRPDCSDTSDEDFCIFRPCALDQAFHCESEEQCIEPEKRCDGIEQCVHGSDEDRCLASDMGMEAREVINPPPPAVVDLNSRGMLYVRAFNESEQACPATHFQCNDDGYCLPLFLRCNGVPDCPGREDETGCDTTSCPDFYRCRDSTVCLQPLHLCDGFFQCPLHDDELHCNLTCPSFCTCYGNAFICSERFLVSSYPDLRYLDAADSGMKTEDFTDNSSMLVTLILARCGIRELTPLRLPNLHSLDLSSNQIATVTASHLEGLPLLKELDLSRNPIVNWFPASLGEKILSSVKSLNLAFVVMPAFKDQLTTIFPALETLNLSHSVIEQIGDGGLQRLAKLKELDVRGCPMTRFPRTLLQGLDLLDKVQADNYKLCCPATLPDEFNAVNCQAPSDEVSSCDALLKSDVYRVLLAVFAALALVGNFCSLVYRLCFAKSSNTLGFDVFVSHLCAADFLMGVYLAIIGLADRVYLGDYLWRDEEWRHSDVCTVAGFLALLSSEVSAVIICLITLDRFLVLRFPFSRVRFHRLSAVLTCVGVWLVGLCLAAVPLMPSWQFYGHTGICIPLPISRKEFPGQRYSFAVLIVFNFVLFVLIALGQLFIYCSIRANSLSASSSTQKGQDLTIARRLLTIAMSDFLCWFPIGLLGLLASVGVAVPGEVNVALAILALPLNSALNPFLYTINLILEKRRRMWEERMKKLLYHTSTHATSEADNRKI